MEREKKRYWVVVYVVGNTYKHKYVCADSAEQAIRRARIKNIFDLFPVDVKK